MPLTPVLVTGGCGFLGTAIVSHLLSTQRFAITVVDINPPSPHNISFPGSVRYLRANVLEPDALAAVFASVRPEIVVHAVGVYPLGSARYLRQDQDAVFAVNVDGTANVVHAASECGARGLVFTSSVTVVFDELDRDFGNVDETWPTGRAATVYGASKTLAEDIVLKASTSNFATCALRSAPIFGPHDPACIPIIHSCIAAAQTPFILGAGTNLQDYVYVDNVAHAHVLAVDNLLQSQTAAGEAIFISNGEPVTVRQLCLAVWKHFGHVPMFEVAVPERLAWWLAWGFEWVSWVTGKEGPLSRGLVSDGCRVRYVDLEKARRILGYRVSVGLEEGLRRSCEWYARMLESRTRR